MVAGPPVAGGPASLSGAGVAVNRSVVLPALAMLVIVSLPGGAFAGTDATGPFSPVDTLPRVATPHLNFITLVVADFERAFHFYTQVLGLRERGRAMPSRENFEVVLGYDDAPLTPGISLTWRNGPPSPRGNGSSSVNLVVRGLAAIMPRVTSAGGKVLMPLTRGEIPQGRYSIARIEDPDGNVLELVEYHGLRAQRRDPP
jgi:predicted enzyme related to lactoylglutathione lyase